MKIPADLLRRNLPKRSRPEVGAPSRSAKKPKVAPTVKSSAPQGSAPQGAPRNFRADSPPPPPQPKPQTGASHRRSLGVPTSAKPAAPGPGRGQDPPLGRPAPPAAVEVTSSPSPPASPPAQKSLPVEVAPAPAQKNSAAAKGKAVAASNTDGPEIVCRYGSDRPGSGSPVLHVGLKYCPTGPSSHLGDPEFLHKMVELATLPLAQTGGTKSANERFAEMYRSLLTTLFDATRVQESMALLATSNTRLRETGDELKKDLAVAKEAEAGAKADAKAEAEAKADAKAREEAGLARARAAEAELQSVKTFSRATLDAKEECLQTLGSELRSSKRQVGELMSQLSEAKAGLAESRDGLALERGEREKAEKALSAAESELAALRTQVREATTQAVADYKASEEFMLELCEGAGGAYYTGFEDCQGIVAKLFPDLDLSEVVPAEVVPAEGGGEDEAEEEGHSGAANDATDGVPGDASHAESEIGTTIEALEAPEAVAESGAEVPLEIVPPEAPAGVGEGEAEVVTGAAESNNVVTVDDGEPQAE